MTQVYVILAAIVFLVLGAALVGIGVFFWYLLKTVKAMNEAVQSFVKVVDPLIKSGTLQQLGTASAECVKLGRQILGAMTAINVTVKLFNQAFFKPEAVAAANHPEQSEGFAAEGESEIFSYSEETAAKEETASKLRAVGIETDVTHPNAPVPPEATGANV